MNSERLLEAFSKIGDDPDCIQQLRKIAIALAVAGKLDKGAATLSPRQVLDAVDRVKADLAKRGIIPKPKKHTEVTLEQLPEAFSDTTRFAPLGELARIEKGQTGIQQAQPGAFPLVVTAAERATCDHFDFDGSAAIIPLVSSTGHGNASINRLHYQEGKFALGTILVAVFPHDPNLISARFLFEYLSAFKEELLVARMTGTANVTLSVGRVADVPIPLICPEVQRKVDELMVLCDQLEQARAGREAVRDQLTTASLARLTAPDTDADTFQSHARFALQSLRTLTTRPDQIKTLRQTILNLAVRGKLVAQDAGDEPAVELLTQIAKRKAELVKLGEIRASKPLAPIATADAPFETPSGWAPIRLGTVIHLLSGQHLQPPEYSETPGTGVPYITGPSDFTPMGLNISRYALVRKAVAKSGQLLLTVKGSGVGKTTICDIPEVAISRQLMSLTPIGWSVPFLEIITHRLAEVLQSQARSLIPGIAREDVEDFVFPLPPLAEQHRIVAKVEALMALCDQLEASLTTATTRSKLLNALLHEALTPAAEPVTEAAE